MWESKWEIWRVIANAQGTTVDDGRQPIAIGIFTSQSPIRLLSILVRISLLPKV